MAAHLTVTRFAVISEAFEDGGQIPDRYARGAGGESISFPLDWRGAPEGTLSFALLLLDTHPVANGFVHWLVVDIPVTQTSLAEGASGEAMPAGSIEGPNSSGSQGYTGPHPPPGSGEHDYVLTLYALDVDSIESPERADAAHVARVAGDHVLATTRLTGTYERYTA
jgi:Raf kinase inhibitor-like YbhB/YbcL family protein